MEFLGDSDTTSISECRVRTTAHFFITQLQPDRQNYFVFTLGTNGHIAMEFTGDNYDTGDSLVTKLI